MSFLAVCIAAYILCVGLLPFDVFCDGPRKLFDGYSKEFLPRLNESKPVKVSFDFELITIKEVNAKEQTITVYGWVRQSWHNPFLQWNSSEYGGIQTIQTSAKTLWVPDILMYNNVDNQDRVGGGPTTYKTHVVMHSNGDNDWTSPALFKTVCAIDVTYFPFDMQTCSLKFGSWASGSHQLRMCPLNMTGKSNQYVDNGEWEIRRNRVEKKRCPVPLRGI
ncbi:hypothetical protein OS493_004017 [Desmophyllum pertusum]|uniref:Neurotransmitter-gated ion-channel ligand-binding domain-containing protein n=1 Tax=Desmophyllum pertusum TaxID=174260 RepID=A0A9W9ZU03_9CNID|nr:hypothetical protein OS493_004017 [Desmophyllum pertusum]